jgi:hypothetical protein
LAQALAIDEGTIGRLDILDVNLVFVGAGGRGPDLCVLARENLPVTN